MSSHQKDRAAYRHILTLNVDVSWYKGSGVIEGSAGEDCNTVVCYQNTYFRERKGPGKDVPRVLSSCRVAGDTSQVGWRYLSFASLTCLERHDWLQDLRR
jgi:hypothetical protein